MTSQLEFAWRAALCRQLAKREPANRALWLAEAVEWTRLSKETFLGKTKESNGFGTLAKFVTLVGQMFVSAASLEIVIWVKPDGAALQETTGGCPCKSEKGQ